MHDHGYSRCHLDYCVYFKRSYDDNYIILCLYVDDMLISRSNMDHIMGLKELVSTFIFYERFRGRKKNL